METLAILAGTWLVVTGLYGALALFVAFRRRRRSGRPSSAGPVSFSLEGSSTEVDRLRIQVETLRSQVNAIGSAPRGEKGRIRRYRSGQYTELPRSLRRQLREVRNLRHAVGV